MKKQSKTQPKKPVSKKLNKKNIKPLAGKKLGTKKRPLKESKDFDDLPDTEFDENDDQDD